MLAVMETCSLNKAAELLNISQPALTKKIQRMEAQLGVKLFERDKRGVRPTSFAESFRAYAQAACKGYDQALAELHASKNGLKNTVTIAGAPVLSSKLFPEAIVRIKRQNPHFRVKALARGYELAEAVVTGECDLAVSFLDESRPPSLAHRYLFNDRWVVIVRPEHPLARKSQLTAQDLHQHDWVYSDRDSFHRRQLERYFAEAGLTMPRADIESHAPAILKAVVSRSDYVGLVARSSVEADEKCGLLKIIEIDSPLMIRPIGFLWRENESLSPAAKALMQAIETVCREQGYR
jgi:DNA-binding transcriptional LysR family regulator